MSVSIRLITFGVYNRATYLDERRQLFNAWGEYIDSLVNPKPERQQPKPANVISFESPRLVG